MKKAELVYAIQSGKCHVDRESECHCTWDWHVPSGLEWPDDGLISGIDSSAECWVANVLYVGYTPVAQNSPVDGWQDLAGLDVQDILEDTVAGTDILYAMDIPDNAVAPEHTQRERDSLAQWLAGCGYGLAIHYPRNFGNEYECVLVAPGSAISTDWDPLREDWQTVTAEEWAEHYLRGGNACLEYYIGFRILG